MVSPWDQQPGRLGDGDGDTFIGWVQDDLELHMEASHVQIDAMRSMRKQKESEAEADSIPALATAAPTVSPSR